MGNIPFEATEDEVSSLLSGQGVEVHEMRFRTDRETGRFRGFAFARLAVSGNSAQFAEALKRCEDLILRGRVLVVALSNREMARQERRGLAVGA